MAPTAGRDRHRLLERLNALGWVYTGWQPVHRAWRFRHLASERTFWVTGGDEAVRQVVGDQVRASMGTPEDNKQAHPQWRADSGCEPRLHETPACHRAEAQGTPLPKMTGERRSYPWREGQGYAGSAR